MVQTDRTAPYSFCEELFNSITHGAGILLSIAALVLLIVFSSIYGNASHVVSCTIFGVTLILLYSASTLYHSVQKPQVKSVFKILDHSCIYLLIAGTYTPFLLVTLRGVLGWTMFAVIWFLALAGVLFKVFFVNRFKIISTIAYVLMGWIIIFAIKPLIDSLHCRGHCLAGSRRTGLYSGCYFLCLEKASFQSCDLASVCSGRQYLPFLRCHLLCAPSEIVKE